MTRRALRRCGPVRSVSILTLSISPTVGGPPAGVKYYSYSSLLWPRTPRDVIHARRVRGPCSYFIMPKQTEARRRALTTESGSPPRFSFAGVLSGALLFIPTRSATATRRLRLPVRVRQGSAGLSEFASHQVLDDRDLLHLIAIELLFVCLWAMLSAMLGYSASSR